MNFEVLWLFVKVKFEGMAYFGGTSKQSASFLWKTFFNQFVKASCYIVAEFTYKK